MLHEIQYIPYIYIYIWKSYKPFTYEFNKCLYFFRIAKSIPVGFYIVNLFLAVFKPYLQFVFYSSNRFQNAIFTILCIVYNLIGFFFTIHFILTFLNIVYKSFKLSKTLHLYNKIWFTNWKAVIWIFLSNL